VLITARCEELKTTRGLVREFADMLCHRHGEHLETWASQAENSPVSELRGFASGLRRDWAAVTAGLTLPYSSGAVFGDRDFSPLPDVVQMFELLPSAQLALRWVAAHSR
jgi:hypothetical protein